MVLFNVYLIFKKYMFIIKVKLLNLYFSVAGSNEIHLHGHCKRGNSIADQKTLYIIFNFSETVETIYIK